MSNCPKCGHPNQDGYSNFCSQCGHDLNLKIDQGDEHVDYGTAVKPEAIEPQTHEKPLSDEDKESAFLDKIKSAMQDGNLPIEDISRLSAIRENLGISMEKAKELFDKAVQSFRPTEPEGQNDKIIGSSHGLSLSINTNRFYMEGFSGILDIKLENLSNCTFDNIRIEISGDLFDKSQSWNCFLEPCRNVQKRFSAKPEDAGVKLIQFRVSAKLGNSIFAFWAETDLPVFEKTKELQNISIQAEKLVDFGSMAENAKNMGNSVRNHIESLIHLDRIHTANDLITEYRKLPPAYTLLQLHYDPQRSEQLTNSLTQSIMASKYISHPQRGSKSDTASLEIASSDQALNIVLVAKTIITLGRHRNNDVMTRILPRKASIDDEPAVHKDPSEQITRFHCSFKLTKDGIAIKDHSTFGTTLDNKKVGDKETIITKNNQMIRLADVLTLKTQWSKGKIDRIDFSDYMKLWTPPAGELWQLAEKADLNNIMLHRVDNLGSEDPNGTEMYCMIFRCVLVGSDPRCAIHFENKGLESEHALIWHMNGQFYLENLTDLTNVAVDSIPLSKGELVPLCFGDIIHIARLEMTFKSRSQLFIDPSGSV